MPSKVSSTKKAQLLRERCAQLKRAIRELNSQHRDLLLRHNLLQGWCDCLMLLQVDVIREQHDKSWCNLPGATEEFERLLQKEVSLLQELTNNPVCSAADAASLLHYGVTTISPPSDPMALFKHHLDQPPLKEAASLTSLDLAKIARESTQEMGVQLHKLSNVPPEACSPVLERLQEAYDRIIRVAMSMVMLGREDIVESLNIVNLDTLQPDVEGAVQHAARIGRLIDKMDLTSQQQHVISTGIAVYMQILSAVAQERQHLQSQFACLGEQADDTNSGAEAAGGLLPAGQQTLETQQKQAVRLQLLMRKEFILRMAGMTWFCGCLTWRQVAKAVVLSWPYTMRPLLLAQEIQKQEERRRARALLSGDMLE